MRQGDDIAGLIADALDKNHLTLSASDIVVIAQKIVSKAEGRLVSLKALAPSARAEELARQSGKSAALVEAILQESNAVLRVKPGVIVCEHRTGHVMANAGIDHSNAENAEADSLVLLPEDADASAEAIRIRLKEISGADIGVIISDSIGRAWRLGTVGHAIGAAGVPSLIDCRGARDLNGRPLEVTMTGFADAVAAAAVIVMGEGDDGQPVVLVRGIKWAAAENPARTLIRPVAEDMFR